MQKKDAAPRAAQWLSDDLVVLADKLSAGDLADSDGFHFDVIIVGSGYGGGVALHELAGQGINGRPLRIAMLERGREYLPGAFPSRMAEMAGHVRFSAIGKSEITGRETGLFDVRIGPDMGVLLANGLGGGSLINAGVMAEPLPAVFKDRRWPCGIRNDSELSTRMSEMKSRLEACPAPASSGRICALDHIGKTVAAHVTVATVEDQVRGIKKCNGCGDCATGCNVGCEVVG
jgi:cholesterol oxidase